MCIRDSSKPVFYDYVHSRELERVAHGIYLSKDAWVDAMYLLHLRVEQAVFSLSLIHIWKPWCDFRHWHPRIEQHDRTLHHAAVSPV